MNLGFGGEDGGGIYHSIYDDFYWYTHFSDTNFVYGRALAQTAGTAVMRLADAELLPFDFDDFTDTIRRYVDEVEKLARDERDQIIERNREIDEGAVCGDRRSADQERAAAQGAGAAVPEFRAARKRSWPPCSAPPSCSIRRWRRPRKTAAPRWPAPRSKRSTTAWCAVERVFLLGDGLPNRPWFQNQIYAPGFYTGYGVKTLPGVREAIEQKEWKLAQEQIARVGKVLENAGEAIEGTANELGRAVKTN